MAAAPGGDVGRNWRQPFELGRQDGLEWASPAETAGEAVMGKPRPYLQVFREQVRGGRAVAHRSFP